MRASALLRRISMDEVRQVAVLDHVVDEVLRVLTALLRAPDHLLHQLVLLDIELLGLGDLVEHEPGRDRVTHLALKVGLELLEGLSFCSSR